MSWSRSFEKRFLWREKIWKDDCHPCILAYRAPVSYPVKACMYLLICIAIALRWQYESYEMSLTISYPTISQHLQRSFRSPIVRDVGGLVAPGSMAPSNIARSTMRVASWYVIGALPEQTTPLGEFSEGRWCPSLIAHKLVWHWFTTCEVTCEITNLTYLKIGFLYVCGDSLVITGSIIE